MHKALDLDGGDAQILYKLGLSYYANQQYKQCILYLKQCLEASPYISYVSDTYYHIGLAYCNLEKFEKSIYPYSQVSKFSVIYL